MLYKPWKPFLTVGPPDLILDLNAFALGALNLPGLLGVENSLAF